MQDQFYNPEHGEEEYTFAQLKVACECIAMMTEDDIKVHLDQWIISSGITKNKIW